MAEAVRLIVLKADGSIASHCDSKAYKPLNWMNPPCTIVTGEPSVIYGNIGNRGYIPQLPDGCAVEVPVLVDHMGLQPTVVHDIPPQLIALMRTNINVQELTVAALVQEKPEHIYHAAMLDPHTGAELDLDQIRNLTHDLLAAHGDWLPEWARIPQRKAG